jgi:hypothetical protein
MFNMSAMPAGAADKDPSISRNYSGSKEAVMRSVVIASLCCVSVIACVVIAAHTYRTRSRANDIISVTGLAKRDFESDLILWKGSFVRRDANMKAAYESLKQDIDAVKKFCREKGIQEDEPIFSSAEIEKEYEETTDKEGRSLRRFKGYALTQRVEIESQDVDRIERFSREVTGLIDTGIEFYSQAPEYYYNKLGELKLEMIAAATKDGRTRAQRIVENAGGTLGPLRFSSIGVFQITTPNSTSDFTWAGTFDTTSKRKTASVTIKLQFGLSS